MTGKESDKPSRRRAFRRVINTKDGPKTTPVKETTVRRKSKEDKEK